MTFFCAAEAERRGDPMIGTAPPQARVLLVHQPGAWGPRGLLESRCDPDVARRIDAAAAAAGLRLQTIRRPGKHLAGMPEGGYDVGIAETRAELPSVTWWRTDDLAALADDLEAHRIPGPGATVDTAPLYLVCAHGRHDACCALRGRPVARALDEARPGRVWETTHLGGDRFAANLLVLPSGCLYGRVPPDAAGALAERADAGEVAPQLLRGRIGCPPIEQAALVYAHGRLGIARLDALTVRSVERLGADAARIRIATPGGDVDVSLAMETRPPERLTCRGAGATTSRAYRGVSIAPAGAAATSSR